MRNQIACALALFVGLAFASCSDPEVEDRCLDGTASQERCCAADPTYDFCPPDNNANNNNTTTNNNTNNDTNNGCDPACGPDEVCDASGVCVACVTGADCPAATPVCQGSGAAASCVECTQMDSTGCGADEVCDTTNNVCVGCVADGDCTDGVCDTAANVCVACVDDADCTEADASVCDTAGAAPAGVGCEVAADCAGIEGANQCEAGVCVECTTATEDEDCGGNACDVADNTCSNIAIGSATGCESCVSDSSCATDHFCIPLDFEQSFRGNYCMPVPGMENGNPTCPPTFGAGIAMRDSLGGQTLDVCLIREGLTTCEAISVFLDGCTPMNGGEPSAGDCQVDGMVAPGARCEPVGGINSCTYSCTGDRDCLASVECGGPQGNNYCGGP